MKVSGKKGDKGGFSGNIINGFIAIRDNLSLLLPDIILGVFIIVLGFIFVFVNDFMSLFINIARISETARASLIQSYVANLKGNTFALWKILITAVIFVLLGILAGVKFNSIKYDMMKNYVGGKKVSFIHSYKTWISYFWKVFFVKVLLFLMFFAVLLIVLIIVTLLGLLVYKFTWGKILLILLGLLLILIGFVWIKLLTLFVYPALFLEKDFTAVKAIKISFEFFKKDRTYVALAFLIIVGVSILAGLVTGILSALSSILQSFSTAGFITVLGVFIVLVNALIDLVRAIWADMFLFLSYKKN